MKWLCLLITCSFLAASFVQAQPAVADTAFTVREQEGRILLEIRRAALAGDWLITAQIDRGAGVRDCPFTAMPMFRLQEGENGNLEGFWLWEADRIGDTTLVAPSLLETITARNPDFSWQPVERNAAAGTFVLDITDDLLEPSGWYACEGSPLESAMHGEGRLTGVRYFDGGVCFSIERTFGLSSDNNQDEMLKLQGGYPVTLSVALSVVQRETERPVEVGKAEGFDVVSWRDYGAWKQTVLTCALPVKHARRDGEPLVLAVGAELPKAYKVALREAVEEWNVCLPGLIGLQEDSDGADAAVPCAVGFDVSAEGVAVSKVFHPVDGRILFSRLIIGGQETPEQVIRWWLRHGAEQGQVIVLDKDAVLRGWREDCLFRALAEWLGLNREKCGELSLEELKYAVARGYGRTNLSEPVRRQPGIREHWAECREHAADRSRVFDAIERQVYGGRLSGDFLLQCRTEMLALLKEEGVTLMQELIPSDDADGQREALEGLCALLEQTLQGTPGTYLAANHLAEDRQPAVKVCDAVWQAFFDLPMWTEVTSARQKAGKGAGLGGLQEIILARCGDSMTLPQMLSVRSSVAAWREFYKQLSVKSDPDMAESALLQACRDFETQLMKRVETLKKKSKRKPLAAVFAEDLEQLLKQENMND